MKVIIAGSRGITDIDTVNDAMENAKLSHISEIVSGGARGVDRLGERWARVNNIPVKLFIPNWASLGKSAGYKRNVDMARYAQALVAIWDGKSSGTKHMIYLARKCKLTVFVHRV